ncbi:MAG: Imm44 family immunity protein, partial [Mycoplasmatota bacterium]|nr:Imm44 family immunity protein [Mycoplasmatota bacterium]
RAYLFFKDKKYSNTLQIIGIVPIVAPQEIVGENYKEKVKFLCNKSVASIEIKMDFDDYYNADSIKRIELTKEMILTAVKHIITKVDFDYNRFKEDFMSLQ